MLKLLERVVGVVVATAHKVLDLVEVVVGTKTPAASTKAGS